MSSVFDQIMPHPDGVDDADLIPAHERAYVVRAYRRGLDSLVLRGAVRDQKPAGMFIPEDPEPMTMHHMIVDLRISVPAMVIEHVDVKLDVHPHAACPRIEENYQGLVGLSIARGFINQVRQLFGGPRGCTHTTALLQAMAPVAIQSMWAFRRAQAAADGDDGMPFSQENREHALAMNLNSCHVWAEDGEQVASIRAGEPMEVPVWMVKRMVQLGIDPASRGVETITPA